MDPELEAPAAEAETIAPSSVTENAVEASPDVPASPAAPKEPVAAQQAPESPKEPFWYRKELREKEKRLRNLERQLEEASQRPQQSQEPPPDIYQDPQGFQTFMQQQIQQVALSQRLDTSEMFARQKYGDGTWEETNDWLFTRPDVAQWVRQQRDPWGEAIKLYQREKLASEIGDNPDAWREKERERLKAELLAELQGGQPGGNQPATQIPRSLAGARNVAPTTAPTDDRPVFLKDKLARS